MDTNILIVKIAETLPDGPLYKVNKPGNPLLFYKSIINYIGDSTLSLKYINSTPSNNSIEISDKKMPDIVILTLPKREFNIDDNNSNNNSNNSWGINSNKPLYKDVPTSFKIKNKKYSLDSVILRDISRQHFSCYITINKALYAFDGEQQSNLIKLDWKSHLNSSDILVWDVDGETPQEEIENTHFFSFQQGYQQLFYYRVE